MQKYNSGKLYQASYEIENILYTIMARFLKMLVLLFSMGLLLLLLTTNVTSFTATTRSIINSKRLHHYVVVESSKQEDTESLSVSNKINGDINNKNVMIITDDEQLETKNTVSKTTTTTTTTTKTTTRPSSRNYNSNNKSQQNQQNQQLQWQNELDNLLKFDPTISISKRQQSFYNLINANGEIRSATIKALQNRNIDPLLTPTQRKLQEGTRAVARQVADDIIPSIVETVRQGSTAAVIGNAYNTISTGTSSTTNEPTTKSGGSTSTTGSTSGSSTSSTVTMRSPSDVTTIGSRMINAFNTQFRQNLQTFAGDVMNPSRIPQRISQQTEDIVKEIQNVFSETPIGLQEPKYTILYTTDSYEVRHYESYNVATTTMMGDDTIDTTDSSSSSTVTTDTTVSDSSSTSTGSKTVDIWSITEQGAAFNTLASYIFGANQEQLVMEMTTPVTTTMTGEMRFYVNMKVPPEPMNQVQQSSSSSSSSSTASSSQSSSNNDNKLPQFIEQARSNKNSITIETIPESILAVRTFTGFVTKGEVQRQKNILLSSIALDENYIQLDIPHGSTVKHIIFQYNPPYTLPFVRRNEIAIPVTIIQ